MLHFTTSLWNSFGRLSVLTSRLALVLVPKTLHTAQCEKPPILAYLKLTQLPEKYRRLCLLYYCSRFSLLIFFSRCTRPTELITPMLFFPKRLENWLRKPGMPFGYNRIPRWFAPVSSHIPRIYFTIIRSTRGFLCEVVSRILPTRSHTYEKFYLARVQTLRRYFFVVSVLQMLKNGNCACYWRNCDEGYINVNWLVLLATYVTRNCRFRSFRNTYSSCMCRYCGVWLWRIIR